MATGGRCKALLESFPRLEIVPSSETRTLAALWFYVVRTDALPRLIGQVNVGNVVPVYNFIMLFPMLWYEQVAKIKSRTGWEAKTPTKETFWRFGIRRLNVAIRRTSVWWEYVPIIESQ